MVVSFTVISTNAVTTRVPLNKNKRDLNSNDLLLKNGRIRAS